MKNDESLVIIIVWVDDLLIVPSNADILNFFKEEFSKHFKLKDLGQLSYVLGTEFEFFDNHIHMKLSKSILKILDRFNYSLLLFLCFFHDASGQLANSHRKSFKTKVILYIIPFF